jgi:hypothetical protein
MSCMFTFPLALSDFFKLHKCFTGKSVVCHGKPIYLPINHRLPSVA